MTPLKAGRESLGHFACFPFWISLQGIECARFVDMNEEIELAREASFEVMAPAFRLRPIDDADGALQERPA